MSKPFKTKEEVLGGPSPPSIDLWMRKGLCLAAERKLVKITLEEFKKTPHFEDFSQEAYESRICSMHRIFLAMIEHTDLAGDKSAFLSKVPKEEGVDDEATVSKISATSVQSLVETAKYNVAIIKREFDSIEKLLKLKKLFPPLTIEAATTFRDIFRIQQERCSKVLLDWQVSKIITSDQVLEQVDQAARSDPIDEWNSMAKAVNYQPAEVTNSITDMLVDGTMNDYLQKCGREWYKEYNAKITPVALAHANAFETVQAESIKELNQAGDPVKWTMRQKENASHLGLNGKILLGGGEGGVSPVEVERDKTLTRQQAEKLRAIGIPSQIRTGIIINVNNEKNGLDSQITRPIAVNDTEGYVGAAASVFGAYVFANTVTLPWEYVKSFLPTAAIPAPESTISQVAGAVGAVASAYNPWNAVVASINGGSNVAVAYFKYKSAEPILEGGGKVLGGVGTILNEVGGGIRDLRSGAHAVLGSVHSAASGAVSIASNTTASMAAMATQIPSTATYYSIGKLSRDVATNTVLKNPAFNSLAEVVQVPTAASVEATAIANKAFAELQQLYIAMVKASGLKEIGGLVSDTQLLQAFADPEALNAYTAGDKYYDLLAENAYKLSNSTEPGIQLAHFSVDRIFAGDASNYLQTLSSTAGWFSQMLLVTPAASELVQYLSSLIHQQENCHFHEYESKTQTHKFNWSLAALNTFFFSTRNDRNDTKEGKEKEPGKYRRSLASTLTRLLPILYYSRGDIASLYSMLFIPKAAISATLTSVYWMPLLAAGGVLAGTYAYLKFSREWKKRIDMAAKSQNKQKNQSKWSLFTSSLPSLYVPVKYGSMAGAALYSLYNLDLEPLMFTYKLNSMGDIVAESGRNFNQAFNSTAVVEVNTTTTTTDITPFARVDLGQDFWTSLLSKASLQDIAYSVGTASWLMALDQMLLQFLIPRLVVGIMDILRGRRGALYTVALWGLYCTGNDKLKKTIQATGSVPKNDRRWFAWCSRQQAQAQATNQPIPEQVQGSFEEDKTLYAKLLEWKKAADENLLKEDVVHERFMIGLLVRIFTSIVVTQSIYRDTQIQLACTSHPELFRDAKPYEFKTMDPDGPVLKMSRVLAIDLKAIVTKTTILPIIDLVLAWSLSPASIPERKKMSFNEELKAKLKATTQKVEESKITVELLEKLADAKLQDEILVSQLGELVNGHDKEEEEEEGQVPVIWGREQETRDEKRGEEIDRQTTVIEQDQAQAYVDTNVDTTIGADTFTTTTTSDSTATKAQRLKQAISFASSSFKFLSGLVTYSKKSTITTTTENPIVRSSSSKVSKPVQPFEFEKRFEKELIEAQDKETEQQTNFENNSDEINSLGSVDGISDEPLRRFTEQVIQRYSKDVDTALSNPVVLNSFSKLALSRNATTTTTTTSTFGTPMQKESKTNTDRPLPPRATVRVKVPVKGPGPVKDVDRTKTESISTILEKQRLERLASSKKRNVYTKSKSID